MLFKDNLTMTQLTNEINKVNKKHKKAKNSYNEARGVLIGYAKYI